MRGIIPNYLHSNNLFFLLAVIPIQFLRLAYAIEPNTLSSRESLTISSNRTIVALGNDFELGFFSPAASFRDSDSWYLGIWYKRIPVKTYVWVANRDNPLSRSGGALKISGFNLVLVNQSNIPVWSTNLTGAVRSSVVAELLPNGNFVLRDSKTKGKDGLLWQSFDYPTDTLLPGMKLGLDLITGHNRFLTSWKNPYDISSGEYSFRLEMQGLPELILRKEYFLASRSGQWDGKRFSGMPDMEKWRKSNISYNFTDNKYEAVFSFKVTSPNVYWRFIVNFDGLLQLISSTPTTPTWSVLWISSLDDCISYALCGSYAYCDMSTSPYCNCFKGFGPNGRMDCARKTPLSCSGDGFSKLSNMKLPDTEEATVDKRIGLKECEKKCIKDCNCTGYANIGIQNGGSGCVIWTGNLRDIRSYPDAGQDIYFRLAAADLG